MKNVKVILFFSLCLFIFACNDDDGGDMIQTEFAGPEVNVGDGQAWTYVQTDEEGTPLAIGVKFTEAALTNLPTGSHHADEFMMQLPSGITVPPFDHITLDWNEHGHEPMMVYDLPHFDIHFYFMSESERNKIGPNDTIQFNKPLAAKYLPPMYLETPGGVPRMGAHIIDLLSPEISGTDIFTHTFIYGKYDAKVNFLEPMVTKAFLDSKTTMNKEIRQPVEWQNSGYYPQRYSIDYDVSTNEYTILLTDLQDF
ncbi:MAG: DUF5602 domain-containing protein [Maribacter sp.]|nr:DUF5602 domain-containing protein [Maribacter sp.]